MLQREDPVSDALSERLQSLRDVQPPSPKRPAKGATTEEWYSYYAGYADAFVKEVVEALPRDTGLLLDPWNGAGTTTSVATAHGLQSVGFDLNPAAVVIARARVLRSDVASSILPLTDEIVESARRGLNDAPFTEDPLEHWFTPVTTRGLRAIERSIFRLLVSSSGEGRAIDQPRLAGLSSLAALFYLGLFRTVRPMVARFIGSNPTWIRKAANKSERAQVSQDRIMARFAKHMKLLAISVENAKFTYGQDCPARVNLGSSSKLALADGVVDAVITSPPYCTRIDYVVATLPELAALGARDSDIRALRASMIGGPLVAGHDGDEDLPAGRKAKSFLASVRKHDSYAAHSYYWKFYRRYLHGMRESLAEVDRVLRRDAPVVLVAQDSYFKDLHVPVPDLLREMADGQSWELLREHKYRVLTNRGGMNPHGRAYRRATRATESVLIFRSN